MHLDTVMTMVDRDAVTLFPEVVDGARVWSIRPGEAPDLPVVERFAGDVIDALEQALGVGQMRVIPTGAIPSAQSASNGTTATTCCASNPGWSSRMTATSIPTRACAGRASRSSRSQDPSSDAAAAGLTA
jgi:hypothetical protein